MLHASPSTLTRDRSEVDESAVLASAQGLTEVWDFLLRHFKLIACFVVGSLLLGMLYSEYAAPVYVASSKILLNEPRTPDQALSGGRSQLALSTSELESQIQVIESEQIARSVITKLSGLSNRTLSESGVSLPRRVLSLLGMGAARRSDQEGKDPDSLAQVLNSFQDHLSARRIGQSYAIEVSYSSRTPADAARIVNSVTAAYIQNQLVSRKAVDEGSEIIAKRMLNLDAQILTAGAAVRTGSIDVESFPTGDATVLTAASEPLGKSWPRTNLILALCGLIGLMTGVVAAAIRQSRT